MLGRLPVPQVLEMLRLTPPARALDVLLAMPAERTALLVDRMELTDLLRLMTASGGDHDRLLGFASEDRVLALVAAAPPAALAALAAGLRRRESLERVLAAAGLDALVAMVRTASGGVWERVRAALPPGRAALLQAALYRAQALAAVAGLAHRDLPPADDNGVVTAEVFGRLIRVVVRPSPAREAFDSQQLQEAVRALEWAAATLLLVVTDVELAPEASAYRRQLGSAGIRVEAARWRDDRDSGELKRAVIRLVA